MREAKTAHTPGPWRVWRGMTSCAVMAEERLQVMRTSWHSDTRDHFPLRAEAEANAYLTAAAPDMLAALQKAQAVLARRAYRSLDDAQAANEIEDMIAQAIAKATGGGA